MTHLTSLVSTSRRRALLALATAAALSACGSIRPSAPDAQPPVVFVHGNGDTAALWMTTMWRFESNGWPRNRLHAIELPYPLARDEDDKPQPGRTSTAEHRAFLAAEIDRVLAATGARKVALVGNSRGGNAIRSYLAEQGPGKVSHTVLGGTPNHGVRVDPANRPNNEFNGAGAFLRGLNAPKGPNGDEVTPGVKWMTIRSDNNDKFAQPDGVWLGAKGTPTNVTFAGPELKGAENVVIPGIDHRETSYSPQAFAATYRFITGQAPATTAITPESRVVLDGVVSGRGLDNRPTAGSFQTNKALPGATVEVYATDPATGARRGEAVHRKTVGADGQWGPFQAEGNATYEFVVSAPGYPTSHIYRSPFPRSSSVVNLRAEVVADADRDAVSVITFTRPRGYFGLPRDDISLDGINPPAGIPTGVAGVSSTKLKLRDGVGRPVVGSFNGERIVGRAWPMTYNHLVFLELQH